jgi:hypothetical protein
VWAWPNTSPGTNTARSRGDGDSGTTGIAVDTEYVTRRRLITARRFDAWFNAVRTRYACGLSIFRSGDRPRMPDQDSQVSCGTSSVSATPPSML